MHWNSLPALFSLSVVALAGSACSDDATGPAAAVPASVTIGSHAQNGEVGKPLSQFLVIVGDGSENVLAGVPVTFVVTAGGGSVDSATVLTNHAGAASMRWTLGRTAGTDNNSLTVQVAGYQGPPPVITVSAYAGPPALLTIVSGNVQSGMAGVRLPEPLVVSARDSFDNLSSTATVAWSAETGGGWVPAAYSQTDSEGKASSTWVLGPTLGTQTVVATVGALRIQFSSAATPVVSAFDIDVQSNRPLSPTVAAAIDAAVTRWRGVIIADLPPSQVTLAPDECYAGFAGIPSVMVDDVLLLVRVDSIDGPGGAGLSGAPCRVRQGDFTTIVGVVSLDEADLAQVEADGLLTPTVAKLVGQSLGLGHTWMMPTPPLVHNSGYDVPFYFGRNGAFQYYRIGGLAPLWVYSTAGGGWAWEIYNELMSLSWGPGFTNPSLSLVTIGALEDMSYGVSYANADPVGVCGWYC